MCAITNPTSTTPVTAITTFLPTTVPHKATTGLVGQTRRAATAAVCFTGLSMTRCSTIGFSSMPFGTQARTDRPDTAHDNPRSARRRGQHAPPPRARRSGARATSWGRFKLRDSAGVLIPRDDCLYVWRAARTLSMLQRMDPKTFITIRLSGTGRRQKRSEAATARTRRLSAIPDFRRYPAVIQARRMTPDWVARPMI